LIGHSFLLVEVAIKARSTFLIDYHQGSLKNMGQVGGYFIISIFPQKKKTIDDNFGFYQQKGCFLMPRTCVLDVSNSK
jgi:hypothetical protein